MKNLFKERRAIELFIVIMIITVLVTLFQEKSASNFHKVAQITNAAGKGFTEAKLDVIHFLALNGQLPETTGDSLSSEIHTGYQDKHFKEISIEKGSVNLYFNKNDRVLSVRPGSPDSQQTDFISWFAGRSGREKIFKIYGENIGNISDNLIPNAAR